MKIRLLVDLATDRILWYTTDLASPLGNDEHSAIAEYDGELPDGITLQNSWNYGYKNKKVILLNKPAIKPTLVESNRTTIHKLLIDKVNEKRASIKSVTRYDDYVELLTYNDAYAYNGSNIEDLIWLKLAAKHKDLPTEQAAEVIKFEFNEKRRVLFATEDLFLEMDKRIKNATTNDELFAVRTEVMEKIGKI
jgi:hypothetical protein